MGVIDHTVLQAPTGATMPNGVLVIQWVLANTDTGRPFPVPDRADKCVQVTGTFGAGGTVAIQGSNLTDAAPAAGDYATLNDSGGTALTFVAAGVRQLREDAYQIRPAVTAGDGTTSLTVRLLMRVRR